MAVYEKADPAIIAGLRDRMIMWKGIEDGATGMLRVLEGSLEPTREDEE